MIKKEPQFKKIIVGILIGLSVAFATQYFNILPEWGKTTKTVEFNQSQLEEIKTQTSKIPGLCDNVKMNSSLIKIATDQRTDIKRKLDGYVKNQENYMKLTDELKSDLKTTRDIGE